MELGMSHSPYPNM